MRKLFLIIAVSLVFLFLTSFQSFAECEGDFDCDGDVDGSDLAVFAADFGRTNCEVEIGMGVPKTGQTTSYATGDDGDLQMGVEWPDPRFTDNSDGTVTDNLTGLIWLQDANRFGAKTWADALSDCNSLADDGVALTDGSTPGDWRLPNTKELQSLIHFGYTGPSLPNTAGTGQWTSGDPFTYVQSSYYWSATTDASGTGRAWRVYMNYGFVFYDDKLSSYYVWPVCTGQ